jgi:benzoyl-CoA reductase/2-hydroxyglutaryl-CoA dehydratase subunit BcrC/BadD/HgdB
MRHRLAVAGGGMALRTVRWRDALRRPAPHPHLGPPLESNARLKELIARHYLKGRTASGVVPVAWVTSGAPVEPLVALGYHVHYPENHGAVCGIRRVAEDLCTVAESAGWSRDLCSYARTDLGAVLSGRTPVGRLPRPDLLVCCTNICQTVVGWYQALADRYHVPIALVDTPFLYGPVAPHALAYVERQVASLIEAAERAAGHTLDPGRLEAVTRRAKEGCTLWREIVDRARHRPAPITAFDTFIHMAPIVEMRGEASTVAYYEHLLAELDGRVARGQGALREERVRLAWDNLPIWPRMRWLSERLAARGAALVASPYARAWGEVADLIDPAEPLASAARVYIHPVLNLGIGQRLAALRALVRDAHVDGVILHADRSCRPWSSGQVDVRDRLVREDGVPALLLEADHNDPRSFSEAQAAARIDAFLEGLGV